MKKIVLIVLLAILVVSVFSSCSKESTTSPPPSALTESPTSTSSEPPATDEPSVSTKPGVPSESTAQQAGPPAPPPPPKLPQPKGPMGKNLNGIEGILIFEAPAPKGTLVGEFPIGGSNKKMKFYKYDGLKCTIILGDEKIVRDINVGDNGKVALYSLPLKKDVTTYKKIDKIIFSMPGFKDYVLTDLEINYHTPNFIDKFEMKHAK